MAIYTFRTGKRLPKGKLRFRKPRRPYRWGKKKRVVRPFTRYNPLTTTNRLGLVGFPNERMVRMRYADSQALVSTSGSFDSHVYRCNSIFDPDATGTGTQPLGYDQWAQFYNHYVVIASKISCEVSWVSSSASAGPCVVGVILEDDGSLIPADYLALNEQGKSISMHINPSSANQSKALNKGFSAKKFFNVTNIKDNFSRLGAQFGNNPAELANYHIYAQSADIASSNTVRFTVLIDYIVLLGEPKELAQSS